MTIIEYDSKFKHISAKYMYGWRQWHAHVTLW